MTLTNRLARHPADRKARGRDKAIARQAHLSNPDQRGWFGIGGGRSLMVQAPLEWRASSFQACGLWPFAAGTGTPMIGVPVGRSLLSGAMVCCDPISWFQYARLILNPSEFVLGRPGLGKSTFIRHQLIGLAGFGVIPMVLGDLKPDYVDLVEALDGQVIRLGRGRGYVNVLDISDAKAAAKRLAANGFHKEAGEVLADARGRRQNLLEMLVELGRRDSISDRETAILAVALEILDEQVEVPVLEDVVRVIAQRPNQLRDVAMDRGDERRYLDNTENLLVSLRGLMGAGRLGEIFSQHSSVQMLRDRAVAFDVSSIEDGDKTLQAAALVTCWSTGFRGIGISQVMAACGLEPQRHYVATVDELHRPLKVGAGMVDRTDSTTRLNRQGGYGTIYCTHTMSDLVLPDPADTAKARGFVERSGIVVCGGLPRKEMDELLTPVVPMGEAEINMVAGWQDPPAWTNTDVESPPPGRGKFLIKVGGRPGIPVQVQLTPAEAGINDTNKLWHDASRINTQRQEDAQ